MGQVLTVPEAGIDYLLYGDKRHLISNYLYNQMSQLPATLNDFGRKVYENLSSTYDFLNNAFVQNNILQKLSSQNVNVVNNYIDELLTFQAIQSANLSMQRYIMANPNLRQIYIDQRCDGYTNSYTNIFGHDIAQDHYDYRRVTDEILLSTPTGWEVHYYDEQLEIGDRELNFIDKAKIINTWEVMDWLIETCNFDFTNADAETKFG